MPKLFLLAPPDSGVGWPILRAFCEGWDSDKCSLPGSGPFPSPCRQTYTFLSKCQHSCFPPLQRAQGWGTLSCNEADKSLERWAIRLLLAGY
jgi:hypothetical protein